MDQSVLFSGGNGSLAYSRQAKRLLEKLEKQNAKESVTLKNRILHCERAGLLSAEAATMLPHILQDVLQNLEKLEVELPLQIKLTLCERRSNELMVAIAGSNSTDACEQAVAKYLEFFLLGENYIQEQEDFSCPRMATLYSSIQAKIDSWGDGPAAQGNLQAWGKPAQQQLARNRLGPKLLLFVCDIMSPATKVPGTMISFVESKSIRLGSRSLRWAYIPNQCLFYPWSGLCRLHVCGVRL